MRILIVGLLALVLVLLSACSSDALDDPVIADYIEGFGGVDKFCESVTRNVPTLEEYEAIVAKSKFEGFGWDEHGQQKISSEQHKALSYWLLDNCY